MNKKQIKLRMEPVVKVVTVLYIVHCVCGNHNVMHEKAIIYNYTVHLLHYFVQCGLDLLNIHAMQPEGHLHLDRISCNGLHLLHSTNTQASQA